MAVSRDEPNQSMQTGPLLTATAVVFLQLIVGFIPSCAAAQSPGPMWNQNGRVLAGDAGIDGGTGFETEDCAHAANAGNTWVGVGIEDGRLLCAHIEGISWNPAGRAHAGGVEKDGGSAEDGFDCRQKGDFSWIVVGKEGREVLCARIQSQWTLSWNHQGRVVAGSAERDGGTGKATEDCAHGTTSKTNHAWVAVGILSDGRLLCAQLTHKEVTLPALSTPAKSSRSPGK